MNAGEKIDTPTFDTAQEEIAKSSGLMTSGDGKSKGICETAAVSFNF